MQSIKQLCGEKLGAPDGDIGHVKDFYFDDQNWAVRYVIADTGTWLPGRQVLISPYAFGGLQQTEKVLRVNLMPLTRSLNGVKTPWQTRITQPNLVYEK